MIHDTIDQSTLPGIAVPHITDAELAELERLHQKANPPRWKVAQRSDEFQNWLICDCGAYDGDGGPDFILVTTDGVHASEYCGDALADAELITATRNALPKLLAEIRRLRSLLNGEES